MNKRQIRLLAILEILTNNSIGSQDELSRLLAARGFVVTQATLSRDLKSLKTTKVVSGLGGYRYIVPQPGEIPEDEIYETVPTTAQNGPQRNVNKMDFSGNLLIFRTPFGYASGLAYDIDQLNTPYILGTIAGADTVMVAINENVTREMVIDYFNGIVPDQVLADARRRYFTDDTGRRTK